MTRTINGLVDEGLAARSPHPDDGRQVLISRTEAGTQLCERITAKRDSWMVEHLDDLSPAELRTLRKALPVLTKVASS